MKDPAELASLLKEADEAQGLGANPRAYGMEETFQEAYAKEIVDRYAVLDSPPRADQGPTHMSDSLAQAKALLKHAKLQSRNGDGSMYASGVRAAAEGIIAAIEGERFGYKATVEFMDREIGQLLLKLKEKPAE